MNEKEKNVSGEDPTTVIREPDIELDLRGVICPYNFVKTKLKLEAMEHGQILSVLLDDGDPIQNVPLSVSFKNSIECVFDAAKMSNAEDPSAYPCVRAIPSSFLR
jgi:TusA-related sulfurtransferase